MKIFKFMINLLKFSAKIFKNKIQKKCVKIHENNIKNQYKYVKIHEKYI
jgi:hypothetical protein